jgi:hypothetical protein
MIDKIKAEIEKLENTYQESTVHAMIIEEAIKSYNECLKWAEETEKELKEVFKKPYIDILHATSEQAQLTSHDEMCSSNCSCADIIDKQIEKAFHSRHSVSAQSRAPSMQDNSIGIGEENKGSSADTIKELKGGQE